jgi:hypothetical protein
MLASRQPEAGGKRGGNAAAADAADARSPKSA